MIALGYALEAIIICMWYRWILKNELKSKNIIRRSIRNIYSQRKTLVLYFLRLGKVSEEQEKSFNNIKECLWMIFTETHMLIGYMLFGPIFLKVLVKNETSRVYENICYIMFWIILFLMRLKEDTQKTVEIINSYTKEVMIPLEKKPELLQVENAPKPEIKWNVKKVLLILTCLIMMIAFLFVLKKIEENIIVACIVFVSFLFLAIKDSVATHKMPNEVVSEEIRVYGDILESIQKDIVNMCQQLSLKSLECNITEENDVSVGSKVNKKGIPQVDISYGFISAIYHSKAKDILLFTIAHELGHIYYKDFVNVRKRLRIANVICLLIYISTILELFIGKGKLILNVVSLIILFGEIVLGNVMCDIRYWKQIAELRADRLAMRLSKCNKYAVIDFWKEDSKKKPSDTTNLVNQYYKRYIRVKDHPSMNRRMELLEKRDRWYWWEYIEHALIVIKWKMTNKGWNGE